MGHWKTVLPMFHVFRTGVNQQNQGIMKRFHVSPRDLWGDASLRTSKTVLGTLRFARVPRTVFEVLGLHLSQDPSEKGGVLAQYRFIDSTFHNFVIILAPRRRLQPNCRRHHGRRVGGGSDRLLSGLLLFPGKKGPRRGRCNPHSCRHSRLQFVLIP